MSERVAWRSRPRVSRATLTMVVSRIDMIDPSTTTDAIRQTCGSMRDSSDAAATASLTVCPSYWLLRYRSIRRLKIRGRSSFCQGRHAATRLGREEERVPGRVAHDRAGVALLEREPGVRDRAGDPVALGRVRKDDRRVAERGAARRRWCCPGALPGIPADVVVVAAGAQE